MKKYGNYGNSSKVLIDKDDIINYVDDWKRYWCIKMPISEEIDNVGKNIGKNMCVTPWGLIGPGHEGCGYHVTRCFRIIGGNENAKIDRERGS